MVINVEKAKNESHWKYDGTQWRYGKDQLFIGDIINDVLTKYSDMVSDVENKTYKTFNDWSILKLDTIIGSDKNLTLSGTYVLTKEKNNIILSHETVSLMNNIESTKKYEMFYTFVLDWLEKFIYSVSLDVYRHIANSDNKNAINNALKKQEEFNKHYGLSSSKKFG